MSKRLFNFSPGPAVLPESVLADIPPALVNWRHTGLGLLEISHHHPAFKAFRDELIACARAVLNVPNDFHVLCLHGGARLQSAMVPTNWLKQQSQYIATGFWGQVAETEARRLGHVQRIGQWQPDGLSDLHASTTDYTFYVHNESIDGRYFPHLADMLTGRVVADMTSSLGIIPVRWDQHDLVFASAQKNLGCAGLTWVIIRASDIDWVDDRVPEMMRYNAHVQAQSLYNTPCAMAWYTSFLMLSWIESQGGVKAISERNQVWSQRVYDYLDNSQLFTAPVPNRFRSPINWVFHSPSAEQDRALVAFAEKKGVSGLKGHRLVGGLRASCYAGQTEEGVNALLQCLQQFERTYG